MPFSKRNTSLFELVAKAFEFECCANPIHHLNSEDKHVEYRGALVSIYSSRLHVPQAV